MFELCRYQTTLDEQEEEENKFDLSEEESN